MRDFGESPDYLAKRNKGEEMYASLSIPQLNNELDKNCKNIVIQWTKSSVCLAEERI